MTIIIIIIIIIIKKKGSTINYVYINFTSLSTCLVINTNTEILEV